jgi:hypothetical protein
MSTFLMPPGLLGGANPDARQLQRQGQAIEGLLLSKVAAWGIWQHRFWLAQGSVHCKLNITPHQVTA